MSSRIIVDIAIVIAVIHAWWFVALPLVIIGSWMYPFYVESLIAGFVYDSLFDALPGIGLQTYLGTIVSAVIIAVCIGLKRVVRS